MAKAGQGKSENFTPDQVRVLRETLASLWENATARDPDLNQDKFGAPFGLKQRTVSRLLKQTDTTGVTYQTATMIAHAAGATGVDELFRSRGVTVGRSEPAEGRYEGLDDQLRKAIGIARHVLGIDQHIIDGTVTTFGPMAKRRATEWLLDFIRNAELVHTLARSPDPSPPAPEKKVSSSRKADRLSVPIFG